MTIFGEDCQFSHLPNAFFTIHVLTVRNIITIFLQYCDCKWKVSCLYCKITVGTVYQTQCQSGTRETQCTRWPPDMSDLIVTLGSVLMAWIYCVLVAWIYCPTIYIFFIFDLKIECVEDKRLGFLRNRCIF